MPILTAPTEVQAKAAPLSERIKGSLLLASLLAGGVLTVVLMWMLADQNAALKAALASQAASRAPTNLTIGDSLSASVVATLDGEIKTFSDATEDSRAVVAFLTTTCPFCESTVPVWGQLAANLNDGELGSRFLGISFNDENTTRAYVERHGIEWPVYVVSRSAAMALPVSTVPYTVAVDSTGRVEHVWPGMLETVDLSSILAALETPEASQDAASISGDNAH